VRFVPKKGRSQLVNTWVNVQVRFWPIVTCAILNSVANLANETISWPQRLSWRQGGEHV
jgi:hypothetical protein